MTTILVATDFSNSAHWATDYALQLAHQLHTRLVLLHAYDPLADMGSEKDWMTSTTGEQYAATILSLGALREQMLTATHGAVHVSIVARPGSAEQIIPDEAASQHADLLVMSLVGDDPQLARQLGSLATSLIPHTDVPLLVVPPGAVFRKPRNMVLAIDLSQPIDALAVDKVLRFAHLLETTIDVVCVEDEPDASAKKAAHHLRDLFHKQPHTFSFLSGNNIAEALDGYLAEYEADLLVLLPKKHGQLRTFLLETVTQEVARLANVPVLAAV